MTVQQKTQEKELLKLRDEIDSIDQQVQRLISQRAVCAQKVAEVKEKYQGDSDAVFYRPEREAQVLRKVMARNEGPLEDREIARLFREVMSVCLALEKPLQIAYPGPAGTFAQLASHKHFGNSAITMPMNSLEEVFSQVETAVVNYGVVPIENSTQGISIQTLELFKQNSLKICGEVELEIQLHLIANTKETLSEITTIFTQSDMLAQSKRWIDTHCPKAVCVIVDTLQQARERVESADNCAMIAGDGAIESNWITLAQNIATDTEFKARFLIIGRQLIGPSGSDKTSLLIATQDKPGALYSLLTPFREHQISLSRIETYAAESTLGSECSVFYIDFEGHESAPEIKQVMQDLSEYSVEIKVLGSYPRAVL